MTTTAAGSGLDSSFMFNPGDPAFVADPFPTYALLREKAPVYPWPLGHCVLLSKHEDISATLRDPRFTTDPSRWEFARPPTPEDQKTEFEKLQTKGIFLLNGQDHARLRRLVAPAFTPRAVERNRDAIQSIIDAAIAEHTSEATIDLAQIADFIPLRVISSALGIPAELDREFRRFGAAIVEGFDPLKSPEEIARILEPVPKGLALVRRVIEERRKALGDDLLSNLIRAEEEGGRLTEDELIALVGGLIVGGSETSLHLICFSVLNLLRHPAALAEIKADPSLLRGAIEETLRYDGFLKMGFARYALEDAEIRGVKISKGKMVIPLPAGANRDPDAYRDPDTFDIRRGAMDHLSFGAGPHLCLGAPLARLEAEVAIGTLLRSFPEMRLAEEPTYGPHAYLRRMTSLRINARS